MKFANIVLAQGQPCLQEGPHRVPWEEAGHEQGPHDQGGEESRQDREKAENSHWRLSGPGQSTIHHHISPRKKTFHCQLSQSRAAGLIKQLTDAGEQLEQTRLELETFNQLKVDFCVKVRCRWKLSFLWFYDTWWRPLCDSHSPPFIFLDFWVNSNPTATGNFDCGCSSTTREGEELARGLQVNSPWDFQILLKSQSCWTVSFRCFLTVWCYRSMQHSLEEARLGSFPEREEEAEGGEA